MTKFRYVAVKPSGEVVVDVLNAASRDVAVNAIRANELSPVSVKPLPWFELGAKLGLVDRAAQNLKAQDLLEFTRELATLLRAGVTLDAALRLASELGGSATMKEFSGAVYRAVRKGVSLAEAIQGQPVAVPGYYVGLIRAGESGGSLVDTLEGLTRHLAQSTRFAKELKSALYYPSFVIAVSLATIALMLLVVIPEFRPLFESGTQTPFELTVLFALSDFLTHWGWALLCAIPLSLLALRAMLAAKQRRARWHGLMRRVPVFGRLIDRIEAARFCRTLGVLQAGGMPMLNGLTIAAGAVENQDIARRIQAAIPRFRRGESLAQVVEQAAIFSSLGNRLMRVGEESGQMETMLLRLADIYDEEVRLRLTRIESMLVPIVTIGGGLFVGGIVAVMLTAILSSYDLAS